MAEKRTQTEMTMAVWQQCKQDEQMQNTMISATNGSAMARHSETSASRAVGGRSTPPPRNYSMIDYYANWTHISVSTRRGSLIPQLSNEDCNATEIPLHHNLWHELARKGAPDVYEIVQLQDLNRDLNNSCLESNLTNLKEKI